MGDAALRIARAAGYYNAGTIEFLVDQDLNFYFLEMNTRLQVEHPVTEMVTGIDLVREQIRIAAGESLILRQSDICLRGVAIECRIYAEDAENNFMPSPGRITRLQVPDGPGVRIDAGIYNGYEVPIYYDPLLAKLAVWGATRAEAIARLRRALMEYKIDGIKTTLPFFRTVINYPEFIAGNLDTGFIARYWHPAQLKEETAGTEQQTITDLAAMTAMLHYARSKQTNTNTLATSASAAPPSNWKLASRLQQYRKGTF